MPNAQDEFLKEINKSDDIKLNTDSQFDDLMGTKPKAGEATLPEKAEDEDSPRNRRERRLLAKLQAEREANIALNERLKTIAEIRGSSSEADHSSAEKKYDEELRKVIGDDTPEKQILLDTFSRKFQETEERAYRRAMDEIQKENLRAQSEAAEDSNTIDRGFESIEDLYNVDLSGDTKQSAALRNGFIDFLAKVSPKDESGEITEYADMVETFAVYRDIMGGKSKEVSSRQKSLADRSMVQSGQALPQAPKGPITFDVARRHIDRLMEQSINN